MLTSGSEFLQMFLPLEGLQENQKFFEIVEELLLICTIDSSSHLIFGNVLIAPENLRKFKKQKQIEVLMNR
jgi:hypothetical protein